MQAVGRLGGYIRRGVCSVSGPFLPFGGAVDIIVVQQKDGSFKSSPWYVRFGKFQRVLKAAEREKVEVNISVNGIETDFYMCLNPKGEGFFLHANTQEEEEDEREMEEREEEEDERETMLYYDDIQLRGNKRQFKSKSCNFDSERLSSEARVVDRIGSRRSRILKLVLGPKSGDDADTDIDLVERAEIAAKLLELKWSTNLNFDEFPYRERKKTRGDNLDKEKGCSCNEQNGISSKSESGEVACLASEACGEVNVLGEIFDSTTMQLPEVNDANFILWYYYFVRAFTL